ncbi:MAG: response regulator transcription factor [Chloroflexi bacterium]|nr:response regulator transcription factor [Chloroflexota bacterium]
MDSKPILVVDDEKNIVQLAKLYLSNEGYEVEAAYNGKDALDKASRIHPALVVLDLMMPELDGWEVCRQLRKNGDVPIIILTARNDDVDKIVGLELGADDYITKPFNPRELVARVKAVLRRYQVGTKPQRQVVLGNTVIDLDRRDVSVEGNLVQLRAKEFDLLATLALNPEVVFTRDKLISSVWGYDFLGDSRTVDVHVTWLREKMANSSAQIKTVWGVGYKLTVSKGVKDQDEVS